MLSCTDALFSLHPSGAAAAVTGICFVQNNNAPQNVVVGSDDDEDTDSDSDDDNFEHLQFKCTNLLLGHDRQKRNRGGESESSYQQATHHLSAASHTSLFGVVLASCHQDGTCKLWDLATRRCIVNNAAEGRNGPGLAVRRLDQMQQFVYQSRDVLGTVSLHDIHRPLDPILQLHTYSTTFCQMAPCDAADDGAVIVGERNLIALPTQHQSVAIIRDLRCDPTCSPSYRIDTGYYCNDNIAHSRRNYGMLTSLGLLNLQGKSQQLVLGCGMEDGSALFYDLRSKRSPWLLDNAAEEGGCLPEETSNFMCQIKLGNDPVLSLDLSRSYSKDTGTQSLVSVAGCAGDADEMSELPEEDQGTVSTIKIKLANDLTNVDRKMEHSSSNMSSSMKATIRTKTRTCSIESGGKIGVSVCRFRPDGRMFAVGGWDRRLRLFDRASSKPLAILQGHDDTVTAVDWAGNASSTGMLATGAGDGRICIYRVFPNTSLKK